MAKVKKQLLSEFFNLTKCSTNSTDLKHLLDFLKANQNIVFVPEDKEKSITIMYLEDYSEKIEVFSDDSKFKKLESDPLKDDIKKCQKSVNSLKKYVNSKTFAKICLSGR